jgi:hypothetical protein
VQENGLKGGNYQGSGQREAANAISLFVKKRTCVLWVQNDSDGSSATCALILMAKSNSCKPEAHAAGTPSIPQESKAN